ncbi:sulfatase family protein [Agromyces indicus]|uniref:Sulfatase n=1 Tax=Agromyces indicus TaxID=758919 RepID=A0ABU1FFP3_9MICO|nr:sulfatase [Agromyces indicus]MDR5690583.1 sulfatase [Agromyces indicus]
MSGGTGRRPNIVWISTHDINPDLGCYRGVWPGADVATTPNLDRLAAEGVRFDQAFATTPVCAPSRSAIMTGCFPTAIGTHHMRSKAVPPPEVRLLSEYFRMAGYYATNNVFTDFQVEVPGTAFDACTPSAHWRDRPDPEQPFFAAFHGMVTHESQIYVSDDAFAEITVGLAAEDRHDPDSVPVPPYHLDTDVFRTAWARYHDLVTVMDAWAGNLLRQLDEDGLADDTIVVFWSDHGAGFPRAKRWATEAGLRVPVIVRWPARIEGGRARTDVVHLADLAPTMLRMAGLEVPAHMHAKPLFDAAGRDLEQGEYAFGGRDRMDEQHDCSRTVRDRRYRYVRHRHPDRSPMQYQHFADRFPTWRQLREHVNEEARQRAAGERPDRLTALQRRVTGPYKPEEELYDIAEDPHETRDLAGDPAHAETLARLAGALDDWTERFGDLGPMDEDELIATWRPGGRWRITGPPAAETDADGAVRLSCVTPGALIAWTADPPLVSAPRRSRQQRINGDPEPDGRHWRLFTDPLPASDAPRWARAWRLGFRGSEEIPLPVLGH